MSSKLSETATGTTRIGAPFQNGGLGEAHPRGRHDVTRQAAGDGMGVIHANLARTLEGCKTFEEARACGITAEFAAVLFGTQEAVASSLSDDSRPTSKV